MPVFSRPTAFFRRLTSRLVWAPLRQESGQTANQTPRLHKVVKKKSTFNEGGYILLVIPTAAFCLGTWQIRRREWKLGLIRELESRTQEPPVELPLDLEELKDLEYKRVKVRGHFDHDREMAIGPRSNVLKESGGGLIQGSSQTGNYVVTPFVLSDRDMTILVNRGWVPSRLAKPELRKEGQITGDIELTGTVRLNEMRNPFMPKASAKEMGYWMYRDVDKMAEFAGTAPVFLDADLNSSVQGGPLGGQTRVQLRNEHMSYIITWYSLAAITFAMWFKRYRKPAPPDSAIEYFKRTRQ